VTLLHRRAPQIKRPSPDERERARRWAVRFLELEPDGCAWAIGVDGSGLPLFCNQVRDGLSAYCALHHREARE